MPKKTNEFKAITLQSYIKANFNGSNAELGRKLGISRQSVGGLIKSGAVVANGAIYTPTRMIN